MKKETDFTLPEEYLNKSNLIPKVEQIEGDKRKMKKNKWFLNGGRGSGRTFRFLCETYENKIAELEAQIEKMKCCGNCQTVRDAEGNCYLKKDGKCKNKDKWELRRLKKDE